MYVGWYLLFTVGLGSVAAHAQGPENVLVVTNSESGVSEKIGEYYMQRRAIPKANLCQINSAPDEEIQRDDYVQKVEKPVAKCLTSGGLQEKILYIVTTLGVPLKIAGQNQHLDSTGASVDSELTLLYGRLKGIKYKLEGVVANPMFGHVDMPFTHPAVAMYMVTRLAGYDFEDVKGMIDRALLASDRGKVVIDVRADNNAEGNGFLREAAAKIPKDRLVFDDSPKVLYGEKDVIAYASWGFNDPDRKRRVVGFTWLPGAIMTDFVSNNGRTFARPPANWTLGTWANVASWFAGSPQNLSADEIHEGVTGISGHVYEPYLAFTPRPDAVLPAYMAGRTLAESFYVGIRGLSWQNIVLGDPLCRLKH